MPAGSVAHLTAVVSLVENSIDGCVKVAGSSPKWYLLPGLALPEARCAAVRSSRGNRLVAAQASGHVALRFQGIFMFSRGCANAFLPGRAGSAETGQAVE